MRMKNPDIIDVGCVSSCQPCCGSSFEKVACKCRWPTCGYFSSLQFKVTTYMLWGIRFYGLMMESVFRSDEVQILIEHYAWLLQFQTNRRTQRVSGICGCRAGETAKALPYKVAEFTSLHCQTNQTVWCPKIIPWILQRCWETRVKGADHLRHSAWPDHNSMVTLPGLHSWAILQVQHEIPGTPFSLTLHHFMQQSIKLISCFCGPSVNLIFYFCNLMLYFYSQKKY